MKIAYARTQFWFNLKSGGSVGHTLGVLLGFKKNGAEVKIISNESLEGAGSFDCSVVSPRFKRPLGEFFYNFYAKEDFVNEMKKFEPDFIYHRYSSLTFFVADIAKKLGTPLILEFNSSGSWTNKHWGKGFKRYLLSPIIKFIEARNIKNASLIVVVSQPLKNELVGLGVSENKILVNPNGVDINKFNPEINYGKKCIKLRQKFAGQNAGKIIIGFAGTFGLWHGIPQFVEAIKKISNENLAPKLHFLLIGDGLLKKEAEEQVGSLKNVTFIGEVLYAEIQDYLAVCDILVSPHCKQADGKEFFGSPTKIFEYMAMAKGIVASNLGQIGEILENNKTAILVEPGNVRELVEGIIKLSEDKDLRHKLGTEAREKVMLNYTWDANIKRLIWKINNLKE